MGDRRAAVGAKHRAGDRSRSPRVPRSPRGAPSPSRSIRVGPGLTEFHPRGKGKDSLEEPGAAHGPTVVLLRRLRSHWQSIYWCAPCPSAACMDARWGFAPSPRSSAPSGHHAPGRAWLGVLLGPNADRVGAGAASRIEMPDLDKIAARDEVGRDARIQPRAAVIVLSEQRGLTVGPE